MYRKRVDLLSLISNPNGTSRIELARTTGRSPAKIGKLVQRLVTAGVLAEEHPIETSRGRRPILLKPSKDLGCLVGIDIGIVHLRIVVTDLQGKVLDSVECSSNAGGEVNQAISDIFERTDAILKRSSMKLLAVGVSHSGGIDPVTGQCLYWHCQNHWKGVPLKEVFSEHYGVPCLVDDSVHCMALAEKTFGVARDQDTFVLINVGQGMGSGLFIEGQLYRGAAGIAGELGHMTILPGGPRCSCGNRGCLEILASGRSMMDAAVQALSDNVTTHLQEITSNDPAGITVEAICEAARCGDRLARRIINQAASYIGIAVANLINLLNPPLIVFAGGAISAAEDLLFEPIVREASAIAVEVAYAKTKIVRSTLDSYSAARGATLMVTRPALKRFWNRAFAAELATAGPVS